MKEKKNMGIEMKGKASLLEHLILQAQWYMKYNSNQQIKFEIDKNKRNTENILAF